MKFYLEDYSSGAVLLISDDVFLVNNVKSGILDCAVGASNENEITSAIQDHLDKNNTAIGISASGELFSLRTFNFVQEKIKLVKIRTTLYTELLQTLNKHQSINQIGFKAGDDLYIKTALTNPTALSEYASMQGISVEFAEKELKLISESSAKYNFRLFVISSYLKNKINQTSSEEDVEKIKVLIRRSFIWPGIPDV